MRIASCSFVILSPKCRLRAIRPRQSVQRSANASNPLPPPLALFQRFGVLVKNNVESTKLREKNSSDRESISPTKSEPFGYHCNHLLSSLITGCNHLLSSLFVIISLAAHTSYIYINPRLLTVPIILTLIQKFETRLANRPFLVFDFRALWRSRLSARVPESQKLKTVG